MVLDTNVYLSALHAPQGIPAKIVESAARGYYQLLISPAIVNELARKARASFAMDEDDILHAKKSLAKVGEIVVPHIIPDAVPADPTDNHILACAVAGQADLIVSGDKDLRRLKVYEGIPIVRPTDFLHTLGL